MPGHDFTMDVRVVYPDDLMARVEILKLTMLDAGKPHDDIRAAVARLVRAEATIKVVR
jgi:hypothetical protein